MPKLLAGNSKKGKDRARLNPALTENTPMEGTPMEGTPMEGTPTEGTPTKGTPAGARQSWANKPL
jgi:hypothetical protein